MPLVRKCGYPRCFEQPLYKKRYCATHQAQWNEREAERSARRLLTEPWRALYDTVEWKTCARFCRRRDGNKCVKCGKEGSSFTKLSVHHKARVVTLWYRAGEFWDAFLAMATNPAVCVTLCPPCHKIADNEIRAEQGEQASAIYAKPRVPASQRRKRRRA